jgi:hypothetical protein
MNTNNIMVSDHYFDDWLVCGVIVTVAEEDNKRCVLFPPYISDEYMVRALAYYDDLNMECKRASVTWWERLCARCEEIGSPYSHVIY